MPFMEEAVISGFIGKIISDCVDITRINIKEADKNRKLKHQNLQTRIYQVIIDAINVISYNKYKNQEVLYDAAEDLLKGLRNDNENRIEVVKHSLSKLISDVNNSICEEFIGVLRTEISKEDNFDLYKEILIMLLEQAAEYNYTQIQQIKERLNYIIQRLDGNTNTQEESSTYDGLKSRTQEYADRWNENMFLNDFDKRDQKGISVKLGEVYLEEHLPHYIWRGNNANMPSTDLKELLSEYINERKDNKMLLILGQPGIGKSTLITWIAVNFKHKFDDIYIYRFASDLGDIDWQDGRISNRVLDELDLKQSDLNGKILIIDGFDEVSIESHRRRDILDSLYGDWIKNKSINNFSLIITCRENYVPKFAILKCKYITLQPWDEKQIKNFCKIFEEKTKNCVSESTKEKLCKNKEIFGIPLILYMVLALNISIEKEGSIVDVYDKIFSLDGGIYDRCIDHRSFADKHRIAEIKKQIHQLSREIAIWMFENKPEEACIPKNEYQKICDDITLENRWENNDSAQDFLIGNYFKLVKHCEGIEMEELYFVHRSIYEYFVTETVFTSMIEAIGTSKEMCACVFGKLFKRGKLSTNILGYLKHKIVNSKLHDAHNFVVEVFQLMLQDGMTYHTSGCYRNVVICERNIFINMLNFLHLWEINGIITFQMSLDEYYCGGTDDYPDFRNLDLRKIDFQKIHSLRANLKNADLRGVCLENRDLSKSNLQDANLQDANLSGTKLRGVNLQNANLSNVNFIEADLTGANLRNTDLSCANLVDANIDNVIFENAKIRGTLFIEKQIPYLKKRCDLRGATIYLEKEEKVVRYEEYCTKVKRT